MLELALERIRLSCSPLKHKTPGASQAVCFWYIFCHVRKDGFGFDKNDTFFCTSTHKVMQPGSNVHRKLAGILFSTSSGTTVLGTDLCGSFRAAEVWQHQHINTDHSSTRGSDTSRAARFSKKENPQPQTWQNKVTVNSVMLQSVIFSSRCLQNWPGHDSLGCLHCRDRTRSNGFRLKRGHWG